MQQVFANINLGGISDSPYQGAENSVSKIVGLDIHSEPGIIKVNQKMTFEYEISLAYGDNQQSTFIVPCSDGNSYIFSPGKVYKRTSAGVYTLEVDNPDFGAVISAVEFESYIYYAKPGSYLGRWAIGSAWSSRDDDFGTFTNGDSLYHPMLEKNLILYIGDGNLIAQVENGVFTADALDLPKKCRASALGSIGTDLVIGTYVSDNVSEVQTFRWNTWSESFTATDISYDIGVNAFLKTDNFVSAQIGVKGNIYSYNGNTMTPYKRIPHDWSGTNSAKVLGNATENFRGLPIFGLAKVAGTYPLIGVYSIGGYSGSYPDVLNLEYIASNGKTVNMDIRSTKVIGNDLFIVWRDYATGVGEKACCVDKIDWSNKINGAYFETGEIAPKRLDAQSGMTVSIPFRSLPAGTSLTLQMSKDYGAFETIETVVDEGNKTVYSKNSLPDSVSFRLKVIFITSGNSAPEVEGLYLIVK